MKSNFVFLVAAITVAACTNSQKETLPILGRSEVVESATGVDTVYHTIKDFKFIDQDSVEITNATFNNKLYVADFFFTSCPSICPIMKSQLLRVYSKFLDNPQVMLLSHTIDPDYDNVKVLHDYANRLEVSSAKWHFVNGVKDSIYNMAQTSYYIATRENEKAPGGYEHSGAFILVDNHRRIRGVYNGTDPESVDKMMADIEILLKELNE